MKVQRGKTTAGGGLSVNHMQNLMLKWHAKCQDLSRGNQGQHVRDSCCSSVCSASFWGHMNNLYNSLA